MYTQHEEVVIGTIRNVLECSMRFKSQDENYDFFVYTLECWHYSVIYVRTGHKHDKLKTLTCRECK